MAKRQSGPPRGERKRSVDARLRELYAVLPGEFVAARDELARRMASEEPAEAARVKRLRRPRAAVWLLNAVARERPDGVLDLFAAGDRLRQAQVRALRGESAGLREATSELSEALRSLVDAAQSVAAERLGHDATAAVLGEVEAGLRAVATADGATRDALSAGVLEDVPRPAGLELLSGLAAVAPAKAPPAKAAAREPQPTPDAGPRPKRDAEQQRKRDRQRLHARAVADAQRLERRARAAEQRVAEAERRFDDAQRRLTALRREADEARAAASTARLRLATMERDLER